MPNADFLYIYSELLISIFPLFLSFQVKGALGALPSFDNSPPVPQLIVPPYKDKAKKATKPSRFFYEEMKKAYVKPPKGWQNTQEVFGTMPDPTDVNGFSLKDYEVRIVSITASMKTIYHFYNCYNFFYGCWIQVAFERFQYEKRSGQIEPANFDDWVDIKCGVNRTKARQLRNLANSFKDYQKVLHSRLSFDWFVKNGSKLLEYFKENPDVAESWTHKIFCQCSECVQ